MIQQDPSSDNGTSPTPMNPCRVIPPRSYRAYATTYLETPLWSLIFEPLCFHSLQPVFRVFCQLRGFLAPPMRATVVPRILAGLFPASIAYATVGDLVLLTPVVVFFLRGIHYTFVAPSLNLSGTMSAYCLYVTYVTASKSNSPFSFFLGIPYERLIGLHWISAISAGILGGFHGYVAYNYGGDDDGDSKYSQAAALSTEETMEANLWKFLLDGSSNLTGTVLLASIMTILLMSTCSILRRYAFNLWYYAHIFFGLAVVVTLFLHSVFSAVFVTAWWALDLLIRYGVLAATRNRTTAEMRIIGARKRQDMQPHEPAVELLVKKPLGFSYNAGQFVRITIPAISSVEVHPISISSAPHEEVLTLHVRRLGDWSDKLVALAEKEDTTTILIEGPYGAMSVGLEDDVKYKLVLCVSGGIGVTPCQSIGKQLLHSHRVQGRHLKQLRFVWAVRDHEMVRDIPPLLLDQEPQDDYSMASPDFQRMVERSEYFRGSGTTSRSLPSSSSSSSSMKMHAFSQISSTFSLRDHAKDAITSSGKLTSLRRPAVVQVDIYCTRNSEEVDTEASQRSLPYNLYKERPNLDDIFATMKEDALALGETNVAVIGCGPPSLMLSLQEACREHSASIVGCHKGGVFFDLHKEHFEL